MEQQVKKARALKNCKEKKEVNNLRKLLGMPVLKEVDRPCMRCGKIFTSEGIHNKMCYDCGRSSRRVAL